MPLDVWLAFRAGNQFSRGIVVTEKTSASQPWPFSVGAAFNTAAQWTSQQCGRASTFAVACAVIVIWAVTGPVFHYSDTWQLIINTGTTIVTFLMVFLIQNTQNRDSEAMHIKLDELIRAVDGAHNQMIDIENLSDLELDELQAKYEQIKAAYTARHGKTEAKTV